MRAPAFISIGLTVGAGLFLAACDGVRTHPAPAEPIHYSARIRWTDYGIPHIEAADFAGLGFGVGYAFAKENSCLLFDTALTVRGERSRFFGADGPAPAGFAPIRNIDSDIFFRSYFDVDVLSSAYRGGSPDALALLKGYVAGANRYLAETGASGLPASCRSAPWVRPLTFEDMVLMVAQKAVEASGSAFASALAAPRPPGRGGDADLIGGGPPSAPLEPNQGGSNAYAFGRDLTANRHGLLVGNPHFPWQGHNRFFEMHLTIPGHLDVMGASLTPLPVVNIGFNRDVAWSHTVSTGRRFTLVELSLVPGHPLDYMVDGHAETMRTKTVVVPVLDAQGKMTEVAHTTYETRFGPIVVEPDMGLNWTAESAFAFADSETANTRIIEQWLRLDEAPDVSGIRDALAEVQGAPWVNTIAADRAGNVFYADYSVVPEVDDTLAADCAGTALARRIAQASGTPVLDGTRSRCDWLDHRAGAHRGIMAADRMPSLMRSDYVLNSNDSYWLANADAPLVGYPRIIGTTNRAQGWRTRMGYKAIGELIAGKPSAITPADAEYMVLSDRNYVGELVADDIAALCLYGDASADPAGDADMAEACHILSAWDRKDTIASRGAPFFREFWRRAGKIDNLWRRGFDSADPTRTPAGLNIDAPVVREALRSALVETMRQFRELDLAPDVALGAVQRRSAEPEAISIPGGAEFEGVLNEITTGPLVRAGYDNKNLLGSSYMQVVTWDATGPVADALVTYSQSTDPSGAHYADQTKRYAAGTWIRLPFTAQEIAADPALKTETIEQ